MATTTNTPQIPDSVFIGEGAVVWGDVVLGEDSSVWYNATIRGDQAPIRIGDRTNVQDNAVIHVSDNQPVELGSNVTIGHSAIIHGCTIGDDSLIGMGAIVMNGAKIGKRCTIGAGSLVTQGTEIPDGSLAFGSPARVVREADETQIAAALHNADRYVELAQMHKESQQA